MATMYPTRGGWGEEGERMGKGERGEEVVYREMERLPEGWVVIHDCWRYYMDRRDRHVNYEVDFIVLVPGKGFVVVEVKNWNEAKVEDGEWWFRGRGGKWVPMGHKVSPLHQAFLGAKRLNRELCEVREFGRWYTDAEHREGLVEYHGLAVLLNQTREQVLPAQTVAGDAADAAENGVPLEQLYICGEQDLEDNLRGKIERLFAGGKHYRPLEGWQVRKIVQYLLPSFYLKGDPVAYNRLMEEATARLHGVLPMLRGCRDGVWVEGCAGSGKTWMAVREMERLCAVHGTGRRVLYLCFNLALAEQVRRLPELQAAQAAGALEVYAFPALCREIAGVAPAGEREQREWYQRLQVGGEVDVVAEVLRRLPTERRYDDIFVDECQDFPEAWGRIIEALQGEEAKMYYFADDRQNLYVTGGRTYCPQTPTVVRLERNLRNSSAIARYSAEILPGGGIVQTIEMPGPEVWVQNAVPDAEERARRVRFWIDRLMHGKREERHRGVKEGQQNGWLAARAHQIVVLSPYSAFKAAGSGDCVRPGCCLPYVRGLALRDAEVSNEELVRRRLAQEEVVVGMTVRAFKGLEADYVILTDVDAPGVDRAQTAKDFYVACTRAKYGLVIIPKSEEGEKYARCLLKN
ncbi:MAG: NERD domain-containing protein [Akkermansiaceae bacterium]|nr:NERD domain-containing protein [Akkermansiaceae bacterium]